MKYSTALWLTLHPDQDNPCSPRSPPPRPGDPRRTFLYLVRALPRVLPLRLPLDLPAPPPVPYAFFLSSLPDAP